MTDTIYMIHGMWGGSWYWENFKTYFERRGYECVSPTLRYHDVNPEDPPDPRLGTTSITDYVDDLERDIKKISGTPIIMGHSMGALLGQILAARGLGKSLVLLTPASPAGIMALTPSVIKCFRSVLTRWKFWERPNRPTFEEAVYSTLHLVPEDTQIEIYNKLVYESGRAAFEIGFWLLDGNGAARVDESLVTCPVLVVAGSEDRITPASVNRKVAAKYDSVSTYLEFKNHAHWVVGEPGWEDIAGGVLSWLQKVSP